MTFSRLFACVLGLAALALSFYAYEEYIAWLGFPDGHVTELGTAERRLASVFIALSLPLGLYLLYLATLADPRKVDRRLAVTAGLYVLVLVGTGLVDRWLQARLDGGVGG